MAKSCNYNDCTNPVFGGGMCTWHQMHRTDKKPKGLKRSPLRSKVDISKSQRKPIKRHRIKPISNKRRKELSGYSQIDLFIEIWDERESDDGKHYSELTRKELFPKSHGQWIWQFLHVLGKGTFTTQTLVKRNILLGLPDEHAHQDRYEVFVKRKQELTLIQYKRLKKWIN